MTDANNTNGNNENSGNGDNYKVTKPFIIQDEYQDETSRERFQTLLAPIIHEWYSQWVGDLVAGALPTISILKKPTEKTENTTVSNTKTSTKTSTKPTTKQKHRAQPYQVDTQSGLIRAHIGLADRTTLLGQLIRQPITDETRELPEYREMLDHIIHDLLYRLGQGKPTTPNCQQQNETIYQQGGVLLIIAAPQPESYIQYGGAASNESAPWTLCIALSPVHLERWVPKKKRPTRRPLRPLTPRSEAIRSVTLPIKVLIPSQTTSIGQLQQLNSGDKLLLQGKMLNVAIDTKERSNRDKDQNTSEYKKNIKNHKSHSIMGATLAASDTHRAIQLHPTV